MSSHKKISILGSGRVGSSIAYSPDIRGIVLRNRIGGYCQRISTGRVLCTGCDLHHRQQSGRCPYICSTGDYRTAKRACHWNRNFQTVKRTADRQCKYLKRCHSDN